MRDAEKPAVHRFAHAAMGTTFEVMVTGCTMRYASQAAQAVFAEVDRLENLFNRFNASSEISQINRLKPGQSIRIGLETYACLTIAEEVCQKTARAFDANYRCTAKSRGRGVSAIPGMALSSSDGFSISLETQKAESVSAGLDLDLGGIGKGYALDRAVEVLSEWSIDRFLLHAGTSTAFASGDAPSLGPDEQGWPVGAGMDRRLFLKNRALSGSGTAVKGQHILDPRTGRPADRHLAVWVSHPSAARADALSTGFMAMSLEEIARHCHLHREVWASVLSPDRTGHVFNREILV